MSTSLLFLYNFMMKRIEKIATKVIIVRIIDKAITAPVSFYSFFSPSWLFSFTEIPLYPYSYSSGSPVSGSTSPVLHPAAVLNAIKFVQSAQKVPKIVLDAYATGSF